MSTQPTASSLHGEGHDDADLWQSEDSGSVNSFEVDHAPHTRVVAYLSTNIITRRNITLADVITESVTPTIIRAKETILVASSRFR